MDGAQWLRQCQLDRAEYQQKADQETRWKQQEQQPKQQPKQQLRSSFPLPRMTTQATATIERKQREAAKQPQPPSSPPPRPPTQINALKHWNMQTIMAGAAARTGAAAAEELIRVEEEEAEVGDVVWDRLTRCQFRNGRQIVYYPPRELPLSPHRAAQLRLRMLQQEQHLFVPASLTESSTSTTRSVRTLLAAAIVEATTTVAATTAIKTASVHPRSPIAIQKTGDRRCTPSCRGDGETSTQRTTTVAAVATAAVAARKKKRLWAAAAVAAIKKKHLCRFPGCTRIIKSQGRCRRHGAKVKRCKVEGCDKQAQGTHHQGMCKRHWRELTCTGTMKRNHSRVSAGVATGVTKQNTAVIDPKNTEEPSATTRTPRDPVPSNSAATMMTTTAITEDNSQASRRTTTVPIKEEEQEDADDYRQQQQQQHGDEDCDNNEDRLDEDTMGFWSRPTSVKVENHNDKEEERLWTTFFQEEGDVDDDDNETSRDEQPEDKTVTAATRNTATVVMPTILVHPEAITSGGEEIVF